MIPGDSQDRRRELGAFVRAQRERLSPAVLGLPPGVRRRTPGLRREEIAQASGLSVTWYTWLEQGREVSVSPAALMRLAKALRLGRAERAYLFELSGKRDPEASRETIEPVAEAVLACVHAITAPAYILDRRWTAQSWNAPAQHLFAGWLDADAEGERNLLRFIFLAPAARTLIRDYDERAHRVAAEFRADVSTHPNDPAIRSLIEELRDGSAEFRRVWNLHGVLEREGGLRTFDHPADGFLRFEQVSFTLASQHGLKLTILMPQT
jgi:transcriptional regulator with XRE-family HTH domain